MSQQVTMSPGEGESNAGPPGLPLIRASELGQYSFCHRAWWLGMVKKVPVQNQAAQIRGVNMHRRHAHQVQTALRWRQAGLVLLGSSGFFLMVGFLWFWFSY